VVLSGAAGARFAAAPYPSTMTNWVTVSSFATAGGTLVLALATFASVRSAHQAGRTAGGTLQVNLRPVLVPSRPQDPAETVTWSDGHRAGVAGGRAAVEIAETTIYLAMSLRNIGAGIAVIHGWWGSGEQRLADIGHAGPDDFRMQTRDTFVPPRDISAWQEAIRDETDPLYVHLTEAVTARRPISIELLYGDHEGGQRAISRFGLIPRQIDEDLEWTCTVVRHWNLDGPDPR
jgi:hypothetical protein